VSGRSASIAGVTSASVSSAVTKRGSRPVRCRPCGSHYVLAGLERERREQLYALLQLPSTESPATCVAAETAPA
jgi:hypothetical protein